MTQDAKTLSAAEKKAAKERADEAGKVVVFYQGASTFDARYSTIGFDEAANLDEGTAAALERGPSGLRRRPLIEER